jgi:hypothetical protein
MTAAEANSIFRFMKHDPFVLGFTPPPYAKAEKRLSCGGGDVSKDGRRFGQNPRRSDALLINLWRFYQNA